MRLFICILLLSPCFVNAQNIGLTNYEELVTAELENENESNATLHVYADVQNNHSSSLEVFSKYEVLSSTMDMDSFVYSFCWVNCYGAATIESPFAHTIAPGEVVEGDFSNSIQGFDGKIVTDEYGTIEIRQTFYTANQEYSSHIDITFCVTSVGADNCAVSVSELEETTFIGNPYPNPSNGEMIKLDYSIGNALRTSLIITNLLGEKVEILEIQNRFGTAEINISELSSGIYSASLVTEKGIISNQKFVVN